MIRRALWTILLLAVAARAQPSADLLAQLESAQRQAADRNSTLRDREQAADKAMEVRLRVIAAANAGEPRLPGWLMDAAAAELGRLGRNGADTAVLFGIPLPEQVEAVRLGARRAAEMLDRAGALLAERHKAVESAPPDDPIKVQIEQDRTVRIPFFASRARVLLAAHATGEERTREARAAFEAVGKLALSNTGPESIRRVTVGVALLFRATPPDAADLQTAADEFGWVLTSEGGRPPAGVSATTQAEAWCGLIAAAGGLGKLDTVLEKFRQAQKAEPFTGPDGKADALLAVIAADSCARTWANRAVAMKDASLLHRAIAEQQALLRRTDLPLRADSLRPLVYQKLYILSQGITGLDLPAAMDLAGAIDAAKDPGRRAEAVQRLRAVADSPDAGDFAVDALWELAVLQTAGPPADRLAAVEALLKLAGEHPTSSRADDAMAAALPHAQALAQDASLASAPSLYRQALTLAVSKFKGLPTIDIWRYEYARVLVERPAGEAASVEDQRAALAALRLVKPGAVPDAPKLLERTQAQLLDASWKRIAALRRVGRAESVTQLCREEVLPEARWAVEWASAVNASSLDRFRADLAEALTESGDAGGRKVLEDLLARKVEVPGSWPRLRLALARSLLISGETPAAFALLRDLSSALDAPIAGQPSSSRPDAFWHAWTLMLEELASHNADGARNGTIRAHIKRLETTDAQLGGEPWKTRITAVRDKLKG